MKTLISSSLDNKMQRFPVFPTFLCFLLMIIFILQKKWNKSKTRISSSKLPPGPRKLPIIGNLLHLIGSLPHHRLRDLANKYGPVMHLQLGELSYIVISSSEAAEEVMKTHDISFAQRPFLLVASIVMYDFKGVAFGPYGENWRQLRKICNLELLSTKRVQSLRSIREEEVILFINSISSSSAAGSPINFSKMVFDLSNTITLRAAFGTIISKQKNDELLPLVQKIVQIVAQMLEGFSVVDVFPSVKFLQVITGMRSKLERVHKEADVIFENIINEHREKKKKASVGPSDLKGEEDDLVDVLLNLQENGVALNSDTIKAVMLDILLGGTETISSTIEWAMSEMIKNSRVMEKAQAEVRQIFNEKHIVDETRLEELKYLKLVIKETLRLHPPGPLLLPRECKEKVEMNGYEIAANTKVIVNAWAIGRDPSYWSEAEKFYPERFLDNSINYKGNDFQFIPFGAGRRMCPGISYAAAVVELSLASLLYHFDWKLPNDMEPKDLDMSESFGASVRRKTELVLIPIPYSC